MCTYLGFLYTKKKHNAILYISLNLTHSYVNFNHYTNSDSDVLINKYEYILPKVTCLRTSNFIRI